MYFHQNFQLIFQKSLNSNVFLDPKEGDNSPSLLPLCASMHFNLSHFCITPNYPILKITSYIWIHNMVFVQDVGWLFKS